MQRCELISIAYDQSENYGLQGVTHWMYDQLTEITVRKIKAPAMSRSSIVHALNEIHLKPI